MPGAAARATRSKTTKVASVASLNSSADAARKPLIHGTHQNVTGPHRTLKSKSKLASQELEQDKEPIKAYLRIRPHLGDRSATSEPYLRQLSEATVQLTDLAQASRTRATIPSQTTYTFTRVFPSDTCQEDFFQATTVPLIKDLLEGQNGLMFAYGVTNSGKTYTIQGGSENGSSGVLPRALDVVFNSIEGMQSETTYRPVHLSGIALGKAPEPRFVDDSSVGDLVDQDSFNLGADDTTLKTDRNYEYSVWLSYAEIYNEKVYDLLAQLEEPSDAIPRSNSKLRLPQAKLRESTIVNPITVKRKALGLKNDPEGVGKYIAGLREVRARSAEEAKLILKTGQVNRRVFGTLANSASSRSHGVFTIKLLRVHKGARQDPDSVLTARLCIVDLAGSERYKNTQNTGVRLKEAGSINKSLMVLGQCMEALRINQRKLAASLAGSGRGDTRDVRLGVVPFRHSKLTEVFQDFFVGSGRAVMVVNVNPYDTGFDENSHVMKFSAIAKEINTTMLKPVSKVVHTAPTYSTEPATTKEASNRRQVTLTMQGSTKSSPVRRAYLEVLEEDEDVVDDDEEPINPLVDTLFDEVEELRYKLYEAELKSVIIEAETRDEVMTEMEERMSAMARRYEARIRSVMEQADLKTNAKLDIIGFAGRTPGPIRQLHHQREGSPHLVTKMESDDEMNLCSINDSFASSAVSASTENATPSPPSASLPRSKFRNLQSSLQLSPMKIELVSDGEEVGHLPSEDDDGDDDGRTADTGAESDDPIELEDVEDDEDSEDDADEDSGGDEEYYNEGIDAEDEAEAISVAASTASNDGHPGLPSIWGNPPPPKDKRGKGVPGTTTSPARQTRGKSMAKLEEQMNDLCLLPPRRSTRSRKITTVTAGKATTSSPTKRTTRPRK